MSPSEEKKVLIIAYYWPPSAGSGVQRWLKFVKYLPQFGWKPFVFTPQNPSFELKDVSLENDVPAEAEIIRFPIWEPYELFFRMARVFGAGKKRSGSIDVKKSKPSLFEKMSTWIRGNFFIPDPRVFWVRPSVKFLTKFLSDNNISKIITTGPPHSMHLIGYQLKKSNPSLTWLADFRDPWSEWGFLDSLMMSRTVLKKHRQLERNVLTTASLVTTITPFYRNHFEKLGGRRVELLTNGFDESDFRALKVVRPDKFVMRHVGIVNEKCDPRPFVMALRSLAKADNNFSHDFELEFIGEVHPDFKQFVFELAEMKEKVIFTKRVDHKALIPLYGSSALLVLILTGYKDAEGYMPGKLFEYMAAGIPILGVGPVGGDASKMMEETGSGKMFDGSDHQAITNYILAQYTAWKEMRPVTSSPKNAGLYSRREITGALSRLLSD
jgi:glycosyltransferase involved in cell wall biosynthesis